MTSAPAPRDGLARVKKLQLPIEMETELEQILAHWDLDDVFNEDLESLMFEVEPLPAAALDCHNPWMVVIAMNGGGSAYGLYLHPDAVRAKVAPWVLWDHEEDCIYALAADTNTFFSSFVRDAEEWIDEPERIARVRRSLGERGVTCSPSDPPLRDEEGADWLPPLEAALHPLQHYLGQVQVDPAAAEHGLLAYASRHQNTEAKAALESMYKERGWSLPWSLPLGDFSFFF